MSGGYIVRNLTPLSVATTASTATNAVGSLDDAVSLTIFLTSSATSLSSGSTIQISQFDPAISAPVGVVESTNFHTASTTVASSGSAVTVTNVSFRGLRLSVLASANVAGEVVAFVSKQIYV